MARIIVLITCLISVSTAQSQNNKTYYTALIDDHRWLCSYDMNDNSLDTIDKLEGAQFLKIGSTFDQENDHYIIGTQELGIAVYDVADASLVNSYSVSGNPWMIRFDNNTSKCYFCNLINNVMTLHSINLENGNTQEIGVISGVTSFSDLYTYDPDNKHFIFQSNLGITVVDISDASIVATYPSNSYYWFDYDESRELMYLTRQFGPDLIFGQIDLENGDVQELDTLPQVSGFMGQASSFNPTDGYMVMGTPDYLMKVDVTDGSLISQISGSQMFNAFYEVSYCTESLNTKVDISNNELTAREKDANYQWVDCSNGFEPIEGATQRSFSPNATGNYAVALEFEGCTDTSSCYSYALSIEDATNSDALKVYPNPTTDKISVFFASDQSEVDVTITNSIGTVIAHMKVAGRREFVVLDNEPSGVYTMSLTLADGSIITKRIIKH